MFVNWNEIGEENVVKVFLSFEWIKWTSWFSAFVLCLMLYLTWLYSSVKFLIQEMSNIWILPLIRYTHIHFLNLALAIFKSVFFTLSKINNLSSFVEFCTMYEHGTQKLNKPANLKNCLVYFANIVTDETFVALLKIQTRQENDDFGWNSLSRNNNSCIRIFMYFLSNILYKMQV